MPSLATEVESTPQEVISSALERFDKDRIAISFSGAEDVVLIDMAFKLVGTSFRVFTLDTGRLHAETYEFIEKVRGHYNIEIDVLSPDNWDVEELVREKGLFSFYKDGHTQCCGIRKIASLERKLSDLDAWITGQRRDQGTTRTNVPHEQVDTAFSTRNHEILKFNPLASWESQDVWSYIREHDVPYNVLHEQGYKSIGCAPCTRPIEDSEPERAGRWWWEHEDDKECGLHVQNVSYD
ncbi:MAG: phosphoadenylyl-sulfate reductase [Gammaproteobacteria bacterium]|nr:phosphoadenylyl-sulfate reductase [Gammaproteobacteria bacterium]